MLSYAKYFNFGLPAAGQRILFPGVRPEPLFFKEKNLLT